MAEKHLMTNISSTLDIAGCFFVTAFAGKKISTIYNLSPKAERIATLLFGGTIFLNAGGIPLYYYLKSFLGDLSITSLVLLTGWLFSYILNINLTNESDKKKTLFFIAFTGSIFYPFALGFTYFDPYILGFQPYSLLTLLFVLFLLTWVLKVYTISVCLIFAASAYFFKIHASMNLWDYILDPWVVFYSIFSLIKPLIPFKWIKKCSQPGISLIAKGFETTMKKIKESITTISSKLPKLLQFILFSIILFMLTFTVLRIIFYNLFSDSGAGIPFRVVLKAFYIGFKFDLRLALLIHLPLLMFSKLKYFSLFPSQNVNRFWLHFLTMIFTATFFISIADFGYYGYLQTGRIDATSLRFLLNPLISLQMVWESYPVIWYSILLVTIITVFKLLLQKISNVILHKEKPLVSKKWQTSTYSIFILLMIAGIYGKLSHYPLRWSDAFFSNYYFASVVSLNPVLYFFETFKNRELQYDIEKVKKYHGIIAKHLSVNNSEPDDFTFIRKHAFTSEQTEKPNIIIVLLESFAFYKTGISGNPLNPTPNFDKIAREGILFTNFYAPHGGTARSVFTLLTGIPDIEAVKTSSRNPLVVNQHTIVNAFEDHEKYYFIGGSANWGNIRGILQNNIPGLKLFEEDSFSSPRLDVWGISDLHLLEEANLILREEKSPFFAIVHTAGNHKPYTIPKDNRGFQKVSPEINVENYGFRSVDAFNAFRFMDHSLGVFFDQVKKEKYFDNTVFVLLADHGLLRKANHMSKAEDQLGLTDFHTPLVIYSPNKIKKGQIIERVASEVDVLPTLASFLKIPYVNSTFGRNLFDSGTENSAYAFTITHYAIHEIGLISSDFYYRANVDGSKKNLYRLNTENPTEDVLEKFPDIASNMENLCFGIYETARYTRYNNSDNEVSKRIK